MNQSLPLTAAGLTDPGMQRQNNEDTWGEPPLNLTPELVAAKGYLYIVADGVGGHQSGEVASDIAVQVTQQVYYADPNSDIGASLRAAIQEANRRIYHQGIGSPGEFGMSTTITAAVVRGSELVVANVGDSRTYLIHGGQPHQLTVDHTWVEERRQAGILTAHEAANHPQRNVITRSLGGNLEVQVDVFGPHPLVRGDQVLLCSDGLSDLVNAQEMAAVVMQSRNPNAAVRRLVDLAKKRGAPDNVTAVVVNTERGKAGARAGPSSLVTLVGIVGAVLLMAALAFWLPRSGLIATPGPAPTATPSPTPTLAETPTLLSTATPLPTPGLAKPQSGDAFYTDEAVEFAWAWGALEEGRRFRLVARDQAGTLMSLPGDGIVEGDERQLIVYPEQQGWGPGVYTWWVVVEPWEEGKWEEEVRSEERTFELRLRPTDTPTPPSTPTPTATPTPVPPTQPPEEPKPKPTETSPPATQPPATQPPPTQPPPTQPPPTKEQ